MMNEPSRETQMLMRFGPLIIALWGWASLAMAVATQGLTFVLAIIGFAATVAAIRTPRISALIEVSTMAGIVALAPSDALGFVLLGALLVVVARVLLRFSAGK